MTDVPTVLPLRILVVDDEQTIRTTLSLCLEAVGHKVQSSASANEALTAIGRMAFDLIFLDLRLGLDNGLDLIEPILAESPWTKVVVITAYASVETAVEAMKRGATDYLPKPFTPAQVDLATRKVAHQLALERRIEALQQVMGAAGTEADLPTGEPAMERALELARRVADSNATVLIRGEAGTGKERLARAIHLWSGRAARAFCIASCRAASVEALEAELFGFASPEAGAKSAARGRLAFCEAGTLLLKDVGDLPLTLQPKLVRLLRDKEYERQDEFVPRKADVRVIATTRRDLHAATAEGRFREDLLMAVDVVTIEIPPLRSRAGDVPKLAERYLALFAGDNHRPARSFTPDAMHVLQKHTYPGNIRELRNLIERAVLLCRGEKIGLEHLPANLLNSDAYSVGDLVALETIKDMHIRRVVKSTRSLESAASVLGINSITLWRRRKRYGM